MLMNNNGRLIGVAAFAITALLMVSLALVGASSTFPNMIPSWRTNVQAVSSGPAKVVEIREMVDLQVAEGTFSVPIVLEGRSSGILSNLPDVISAEKAVALYYGHVPAFVRMQEVTDEDIVINEDRTSLTLTVPDPAFGPPRIDHTKSRIVVHSRGALPRLDDALNNNPTEIRQDMDKQATGALLKAAEESLLLDTARINARGYLTSLGKSMGFQEVTIKYRGARNK